MAHWKKVYEGNILQLESLHELIYILLTVGAKQDCSTSVIFWDKEKGLKHS